MQICRDLAAKRCGVGGQAGIRNDLDPLDTAGFAPGARSDEAGEDARRDDPAERLAHRLVIDRDRRRAVVGQIVGAESSVDTVVVSAPTDSTGSEAAVVSRTAVLSVAAVTDTSPAVDPAEESASLPHAPSTNTQAAHIKPHRVVIMAGP